MTRITSEDNLNICPVPFCHTLFLYILRCLFYALSHYRFDFYLPITRRRMEGLHLMMLVNNNI